MNNDELKNRFCENPWIYCEIYSGGGIYVCCPAWNHNKAIGNIFHNSPDEIWNSAEALLFRKGILNGTFDQCDKEKCSHIVSGALPRRGQLTDYYWGKEIQRIIDNNILKEDRFPRVVKLGYDASCNIWCPSCRDRKIVASSSERYQLDQILHTFIIPFLKDAEILVMSSDGDPFASKHYRDIMQITATTHPKLKLGLCTNGVLFDEKAWNDLNLEGRVHNVQISIDAATELTYNHVRRGGDFNRLMHNLDFLSVQRKGNKIKQFDLLFVVQTCNYQEMADFVKLGKRLDVDSVQFMLIDHWDRGMREDEYVQSKIWDKTHPQHQDFMDMLKDPIFDDPIVRLNTIQALRENWQPPEIKVNFVKGDINRSANTRV